MFERARDRLLDLRDAIDTLKLASSERAFLVRFNEAIAAAQRVLIELLKEGRGRRPPGFDAWYASAMRRMDEDEVMSLVRNARDYDFSDGPHRLRFMKGGPERDRDEMGRPVDPGMWWTHQNDHTFRAAIDNAPRTHAGAPLERTDPVSLCEAVAATLERLIDEASEATVVAR